MLTVLLPYLTYVPTYHKEGRPNSNSNTAFFRYLLFIYFLLSIVPSMMSGSRDSSNNSRKESSGHVLFESLTATLLANKLSDRITAALTDGVSSLPLMAATGDSSADGLGSSSSNISTGNDIEEKSKKERQERLLKHLRSVYQKNTDLFEDWAANNTFSIDMYSSSIQKKIVSAYKNPTEANKDAQLGQKDNPDSPSSSKENTENAAATKHADTEAPRCYGKGDIPTPDQISAIEKETAELQAKLSQLQRRRQEIRRKLCQVQEAGTMAAEATDTAAQIINTKNGGENVTSTATAVVMGHEGLIEKTERGQAIQVRLDDEKRLRDQQEEAEEEGYDPAHQKRRALSLTDRYEEEKKDMPLAGIVKMQQMLKK